MTTTEKKIPNFARQLALVVVPSDSFLFASMAEEEEVRLRSLAEPACVLCLTHPALKVPDLSFDLTKKKKKVSAC